MARERRLRGVVREASFLDVKRKRGLYIVASGKIYISRFLYFVYSRAQRTVQLVLYNNAAAARSAAGAGSKGVVGAETTCDTWARTVWKCIYTETVVKFVWINSHLPSTKYTNCCTN